MAADRGDHCAPDEQALPIAYSSHPLSPFSDVEHLHKIYDFIAALSWLFLVVFQYSPILKSHALHNLLKLCHHMLAPKVSKNVLARLIAYIGLLFYAHFYIGETHVAECISLA